jgi:fatty acid desaturase
MTATTATAAPGRVAAAGVEDRTESVLLRQTYDVVKDLMTPSRLIYWGDLLASAALGYGGFALAAITPSRAVAVVAWLVSVFALYRGVLFIHEITHVRAGAVPGFTLGWNALIGVPLLVPSFFYDGVHQLHHAKSRYGTAEDPEYLPLAHRSPLYLAWFLVHSVLAPLAVAIRFGLLTPLSLASPAVRRFNVERASSLMINPAFRRRMPRPQDAAQWWALELACFLWVWTLVALVAGGAIPGRVALLAVATAATVAAVNQVRTLAAHLWENEHGEEMTIQEQLLDSVNVPGFDPWTSLWAPVGLRYHALHHLLPGLPYHNLGAAHRRLVGVVPGGSPYRRTLYDGLVEVLGTIFRRSAQRTAERQGMKRRAMV